MNLAITKENGVTLESMKKKIISLFLICSLIAVMCACGKQEEPALVDTTPIAETTPVPTPTPEPTPIVFNPDFVVPDSSKRPIAVMIDNQGDRVLPQGGIAQAQIVYEIIVEHNITRYMPVFWDTLPPMVGPVRSSRHYFLDYVLEHDAIYTHAGGSTYAYRDIPKLKIPNIDYQVHSSAFWDLTEDINNWQDSYTSKERLEKFIAEKKYRVDTTSPLHFSYHQEFTLPEDGTVAEDVFIKFSSGNSSTCAFVYHEEEKAYLRWRMGEVQVDRNTEEQIRATNIIIIRIASPLIEGDAYGRRNLLNIGKGKGYYITGGKAIPIQWSKSARNAQTQYTTEGGAPLVLNRGQTWIDIVPNLDYVTIK